MSPSKINCGRALGLLLSVGIASAVPADLAKNAFAANTVLDSSDASYTYYPTFDGTAPYGPSEWYIGYPDCNGTEQSPINLYLGEEEYATPEEYNLQFFPSMCESTELEYEVDGSYFKVDYSGCETLSSLSFQDTSFSLQSLHIHSVSEHRVGSAHHDAEIHLVHLEDDTDDSYLVVGIFFDAFASGTNEEIERLWSITSIGERNTTVEFPSTPYKMLPANPTYVHYNGSLTTPPCTEGIKWIVMTEPSRMGNDQLMEYRNHVQTVTDTIVDEYGNTNRPNQPLNGRTIKYVS